VADRCIGGHCEVPGGHQIRVDVVVPQGGVFVRTGDPVDAEPAPGVVMAERPPQPGGCDQQLQPRPALELVVFCGRQVAADGVGDVGVDVECCRAGGPVARALVAADGAPRKRHAVEP